VRLYSRNAYDWTERLTAIAATADLIKAKSFTIDGEAVVLGPNGSSRFEVAKMGRPSSPMRAGLAPRASCRRRSMAPISPARVASGSRSAILPASPCSGSGARFGIGDHREVIELGNRQTNDFTRSRVHNGQSMKMGSSLAPTRRHRRVVR
jgi:hypothetical protein